MDISPEGKLSVKDRKVLGGSYIDAQLTEDSAFILTNTYLDYHTLTQELRPYHADFKHMDEVSRKNAAYKKLDTLILRWRNSVVESLFSHEGEFDEEMIRNTIRLYNLADSDEERRELLPFERPFSSYTQITSFDINVGFSTIRRAGSFSTNGGWPNLYANGKTIVIANNGWDRNEVGNWNEVTYLLAFSNTAGDVSPLGAGKIEGYTLNQFSMDVHDGYLRVATTRNARWGFDEAQGQWKEESPTESFITLADISSSPMEAGFILAVGQDADETGATEGLQIAVYDVTNVSNPAQRFKYVIDGHSSSNAQWDHHAFRYLSSPDILILPVDIWDYSKTESYRAGKFMLFSVSEHKDIASLGEIAYPEATYSSLLQPRSMVFDDELVTMKGQYVLAHGLSSLEERWRLRLE